MLEKLLAEVERAMLDSLSAEEQSDYLDKRRPLRGNTPASP
jgi:hypothetical protein